MKRTSRRVSIPDLVAAMTDAGASFYFTDAGALLVRGLASLPVTLADEFFECDGRELVRFLKERQTIEKMAGRAA